MRTDELIQALAADTKATGSPPGRLMLTASAGALIALVLVVAWLKLRPDLAQAAIGGFFWIKAAYTGAIGAVFFQACDRLARPGATARGPLIAALAMLAVFTAAAGLQWAQMSPESRMLALRGGSWTVCTRNILVLGAPMTLIAIIALRGLAPTRPTLAGFAAGAFSGGVAATVYGLHCPEATFVFVGLWYSLGMIGCAVLGALLGRVALRW